MSSDDSRPALEPGELSPATGEPAAPVTGGATSAAGERAHPGPTPPGSDLLACLALTILLYLLPTLVAQAYLMLVPGASPKSTFVPVELFAVLVPTLLLALGADKRRTLRWRRVPWLLGVWAALGAAGWAGLLSFTQTFWQKATGYGPPPVMEELLRIQSVADFAWLAVGAVMLPAFCEESAFRGFIQTKLERFGPWPAIAASTALFAAFHGDLYGIPTYIGLGTFLGWVAWRTGSLWPAVCAHATNNILAISQMNGLPEPWLWANVHWVAPLAVLFAAIGTYKLNRAA